MDILQPKAFVVPKITTTVRDTLTAEVGTLIYDTTQDKLCIATGSAAGSGSWEIVTSVSEA